MCLAVRFATLEVAQPSACIGRNVRSINASQLWKSAIYATLQSNGLRADVLFITN